MDTKKEIPLNTGKAVEAMLEASKMTKSDLSRALGVSVTGVDYMLRSPSMSLKRLYQIAEVAGFSVDIKLTKSEKEYVIVL